MSQIIRFLKDNQKYCFGLSVAALAAYLFYRTQPNNKNNKENLLDTNLHKLMESSRHPSIKKLVITSHPASKGQFRRNLINFVKSKLIEENIKVLINCSKLLRAGCQCFLDSMQQNDSEYTEYYYNALKTQYLVEDTISKIELINEHDNNLPIVMICDNNPMDIKLMNDSETLWTTTLKKYNVDEEDIISGYDLILHIIEQDVDEVKNVKIKENWGKHPYYFEIRFQEGKLRQKYEQVYQIIRNFLEREKQKVVLAS